MSKRFQVQVKDMHLKYVVFTWCSERGYTETIIVMYIQPISSLPPDSSRKTLPPSARVSLAAIVILEEDESDCETLTKVFSP